MSGWVGGWAAVGMLWRTGLEQPAAWREEGGFTFAEVAWAQFFLPLALSIPGLGWCCGTSPSVGVGGGGLVCELCPGPSTEQL